MPPNATLAEADQQGWSEGLNNKIRLLTRRAFGFHGAQALAAMIYLCCGGIELTPPLPVLA